MAETRLLDLIGIPTDSRQVSIGRFKVDGFDENTNTIYEFDGDWWHGNPDYFDANDIHPIARRSYGDLYASTLSRRDTLKAKGYNLVHIWESELPDFVAIWEDEYDVIVNKQMKMRHYR